MVTVSMAVDVRFLRRIGELILYQQTKSPLFTRDKTPYAVYRWRMHETLGSLDTQITKEETWDANAFYILTLFSTFKV